MPTRVPNRFSSEFSHKLFIVSAVHLRSDPWLLIWALRPFSHLLLIMVSRTVPLIRGTVRTPVIRTDLWYRFELARFSGEHGSGRVTGRLMRVRRVGVRVVGVPRRSREGRAASSAAARFRSLLRNKGRPSPTVRSRFLLLWVSALVFRGQ